MAFWITESTWESRESLAWQKAFRLASRTQAVAPPTIFLSQVVVKVRMSRIYNSHSSVDQVTDERGAICANPHRAARSYAGGVIEAFGDQEKVFGDAFRVLEQAIAARAFPGASVAVTLSERLVALKSFGRFTYESLSNSIATDTIFDLASVTKVVATTTMAMILYERGQLDLDLPVAGVLPEFASEDPRRGKVSLHMLLAHSSGLPAYEKLFLTASTKASLLDAAFKVSLKYSPGTHAEYSDIGFILFGVALERIAGETLDSFCQREIFGALGMAQTGFNPRADRK